MTRAMDMGVKGRPAPTPATNRLLAMPRCDGPIHKPTTLFAFGNAAASPTPIMNLTMANDHAAPNHAASGKRGATPVNAVNTDHQTIANVSTLRGPKRSPTEPPATWKRA